MEYNIGSIFRITESYHDKDKNSQNLFDFHVMLVKISKNKCIFIVLSNGNRWSDSTINTNDDYVSIDTIKLYFNRFQNVVNIEFLGHCEQIDYEALPSI